VSIYVDIFCILHMIIYIYIKNFSQVLRKEQRATKERKKYNRIQCNKKGRNIKGTNVKI